MPDRELVLRTNCEHGRAGECLYWVNGTPPSTACRGGSETVLDPERVLFQLRADYLAPDEYATVQDVLDALGGSDE